MRFEIFKLPPLGSGGIKGMEMEKGVWGLLEWVLFFFRDGVYSLARVRLYVVQIAVQYLHVQNVSPTGGFFLSNAVETRIKNCLMQSKRTSKTQISFPCSERTADEIFPFLDAAARSMARNWAFGGSLNNFISSDARARAANWMVTCFCWCH